MRNLYVKKVVSQIAHYSEEEEGNGGEEKAGEGNKKEELCESVKREELCKSVKRMGILVIVLQISSTILYLL